MQIRFGQSSNGNDSGEENPWPIYYHRNNRFRRFQCSTTWTVSSERHPHRTSVKTFYWFSLHSSSWRVRRLRPQARQCVNAAAAVKLTGVADQATLNAIVAAQQEVKSQGQTGTIVDGRVSPAKGTYAYGSGTWTIVHLNESIQGRHIKLWPRIDQISGCPGELQQMVVRTVQGT